VINWRQPFIYGFDAYYWFSLVCFVALYMLMAINRYDPKLFTRNVILLAVTFLAPLNWFVVMARHAKIHVHLDYVLWYLGFIPALFFVIAHAKLVLSRITFRWLSKS
jgi:hypothetical protein